MSEELHTMLDDLRRALFEALADSDEVHRTWRQLRHEGYELCLLVDCKREEPDPRSFPLLRDPGFVIDGRDLAFLRSIGIDPTRSRKGRRSRPRPQEAADGGDQGRRAP